MISRKYIYININKNRNRTKNKNKNKNKTHISRTITRTINNNSVNKNWGGGRQKFVPPTDARRTKWNLLKPKIINTNPKPFNLEPKKISILEHKAAAQLEVQGRILYASQLSLPERILFAAEESRAIEINRLKALIQRKKNRNTTPMSLQNIKVISNNFNAARVAAKTSNSSIKQLYPEPHYVQFNPKEPEYENLKLNLENPNTAQSLQNQNTQFYVDLKDLIPENPISDNIKFINEKFNTIKFKSNEELVNENKAKQDELLITYLKQRNKLLP